MIRALFFPTNVRNKPSSPDKRRRCHRLNSHNLFNLLNFPAEESLAVAMFQSLAVETSAQCEI